MAASNENVKTSFRCLKRSRCDNSDTLFTAQHTMEIDSRDFLNSPPVKSVRFGGSVSDILAKHKKVSI